MILTADQHRGLAKRLRSCGDESGYPTKERAAQMALNHEVMAKMIERRLAVHCNAPPLAPNSPS